MIERAHGRLPVFRPGQGTLSAAQLNTLSERVAESGLRGIVGATTANRTMLGSWPQRGFATITRVAPNGLYFFGKLLSRNRVDFIATDEVPILVRVWDPAQATTPVTNLCPYVAGSTVPVERLAAPSGWTPAGDAWFLVDSLPVASGSTWLWARVRQLVNDGEGGAIGSAVKVMPLLADYTPQYGLADDNAAHWTHVYLRGAEANEWGVTDPNTGSRLQVQDFLPQLKAWSGVQTTGSPIRITLGYDGYWWNADDFMDRALVGLQRAKIQSVGTNTVTAKRCKDDNSVYGSAFTVYIQGVGASRALTESPALSDCSPLFAANNVIVVRYHAGLNSWSWVGLAPETCV